MVGGCSYDNVLIDRSIRAFGGWKAASPNLGYQSGVTMYASVKECS